MTGEAELGQPEPPVTQPAHEASQKPEHPVRDRHGDERHVNTAAARNSRTHRVAQLPRIGIEIQRAVVFERVPDGITRHRRTSNCLLYTSDAADE